MQKMLLKDICTRYLLVDIILAHLYVRLITERPRILNNIF